MMSTKWSELNWLRKKDKHIPLPEFVFIDGIKGKGGYYCRPRKAERMIDDRFYDLQKGVIVVDFSNPAGFVLSAIAHEWRHHCQFYYGGNFKNPIQFNTKIDYKKSIISFFSNSATEVDALLFAHKVAPHETSSMWIKWLKEVKEEIK